LVFVSQDKRTLWVRLAWAVGGTLGAGLLYLALAAPVRGTPARVVLAVASLGLCWPALRLSFTRHAKYVFRPQCLEVCYGGHLVLSVPYDSIEYTGYTAEAIPQHGVAYLPWGQGMLYVVTRPGALVTIDLSRPAPYVSGWLFKFAVKRVLLTADRLEPFLDEVRRRAAQTVPEGGPPGKGIAVTQDESSIPGFPR